MRTKPPGVDDADLQRLLADSWHFDASTLAYQAVGAGSHHWLATDDGGARRFLTVDDLELKPWLGAEPESTIAGLKIAYGTAVALHESGLDFVVAPIRTIQGDVAARLQRRFSAALFPFIEGRAEDFADVPQGAERQAALEMWARLHGATPTVRRVALERGFGIPCRTDLQAALKETQLVWSAGPHSEAARDWVSSNRSWLAHALANYDSAAKKVQAAGGDLVITHGEPHGKNLITSGTRRFLIDWDTVALALPERDLWMLDDGTAGAFQTYTDLTGRAVNRDSIAFYGMAWHLTDIALFVELLRGSHPDDADSRKVLMDLPVAADRLAAYIPR